MANVLTDYAAAELKAAILSTLEDPSVRTQLATSTGEILASKAFRDAARPTIIEAALYVGLAVFAGYTLYDLIIRR